MSDTTDDMEAGGALLESAMDDYYWTCRDGRRIHVRDMDETHLLNAIAMLEQKSDNPSRDFFIYDKLEDERISRNLSKKGSLVFREAK